MATNPEFGPVSAQQNFVWNSSASRSSFFVRFPTATDMDLLLIGAELYQDIEEHDRLVLHFKGKPMLKRDTVASGDPVVFSFTSDKLQTTWNGYVHHIAQDNTFQGSNTQIVCVGASWVLKDTDQKIYKNTTYDKVVSAIGKAKGFEVITQTHNRIKTSVTHTGESYWQLLKRMAKLSGFALLVENTTIYFVGKDKIFQNKKKSAPYFNYVDGETTGTVPRELRMTGTILEFKPIISDTAPEMGVRVDRVLSATDSTTGKLIKSKHPHTKPAKVNPGVVIPNDRYFKK